jgi:cytochrome c peroxidase
VFGPIPDLSGLPANAGPLGTEADKAAWAAMTDEQQQAVNQVFANLGKAVAAFERSIMPKDTRFDRFAAALTAGEEPDGDAVLSDLGLRGLKLFIGPTNCLNCHNGPRVQ